MSICDDIYKKIAEHEAAIRKLNSDAIKFHKDIKEGKTPDDVEDILVHRDGNTPDLADAKLNLAQGHEADDAQMLKVDNDIMNTAEAFQKEAQHPDAKEVDNKFLQGKALTFRGKLVDALERSFNYLPRGMNDKLAGALRQMASFRDMLEVKPGSKVFAGRNKKFLISGEVDNLRESSGTDLSNKDFKTGLEFMARAPKRGEDLSASIKEAKSKIDSMVSEGKTMIKDTTSLVNLKKKLSLVESIKDLPGVRDYITKTYKEMDVAREAAFPGEKGKDNYYHNHIITEPFMDIWDSLAMGDKKSRGSIFERKVFDNGWDAEFAGFKPASEDFVETNGTYWSSLANKLRKQKMADEFRANAELTDAHPDKMQIQTHADRAEPAFAVKPEDAKNWEIPTTADGEKYREMDNLGPDFSGILVHPEVYTWQKKVFDSIKPTGPTAVILKGMKMWKTLVLSGSSIIHGSSLAKKYGYLAASLGLKDGVNTVFHPLSTIRDALSTLDVNSPEYGTNLKLFQNGLSLETYDMARNSAFSRRYNLKTGEQTVLSSITEKISDFTNWQHKLLFEKFRTGLKLDIAQKTLKSDYFKDLVSKHNGDSDAAMREVTTMINDHFGGQNLEMIGRSKMVQSFMQAMLLSPEWTEAKFKRTYGAFVHPSDAIRRSYQISLAVEMGTFLMLKVAAQQLYSSYNNDPRSIKQMTDDILNRKLASIYVGKSADGKKENFVTIGMSENQDLGLLLPLFKGLYDTGHNGDITAIPNQMLQEVAHKLSPPVKSGLEMALDRDKRKKSFGEKTLKFAKGMLPMGMSQTMNAGAGAEEEKSTAPVSSLLKKSTIPLTASALNTVGLPLTSYNVEKEDKKKDEKTGKKMRMIK